MGEIAKSRARAMPYLNWIRDGSRKGSEEEKRAVGWWKVEIEAMLRRRGEGGLPFLDLRRGVGYNTLMITLTESAVKKVQEFFQAEPEAKGKALRIAVESGGCSGFQYAFSFDDKKAEDAILALDGFSVLIDPRSAGYLKDSRVDYIEGPTGSGFKIENPNASSTCGCGQSFGA